MAWWGKLIGGTFGFMLGGPLGAMLGAALGHQVDSVLGGRARVRYHLGDQERVQTAFFTATFSVMGHVAKADGHVSEAEITLAKNIMAQMGLSADQRTAAINLFNAGKESGFALDDVLEQFHRECHRRHTLIQMFLEIQLQAAFADGRFDDTEQQALQHIFQRLGFSRYDYEHLLSMMRGAWQYQETHRVRPDHRLKLDEAYTILGVAKTASDEEIKKVYRRLMSQHHPDKLVAKGLPEEMMALAKEKAQAINRAYDEICEARRTH
ncbi:MAG: co-chaperone DjlA [Acidiferrobacterales bacterium]